MGGLSVPIFQHFSDRPAPASTTMPVTMPTPPAVLAPPVSAPLAVNEAVAGPVPAAAPGPHHAHGIVIRLELAEHRLLLRDGERIEGYLMHRRGDGAAETPESIELARRFATLTVGSEVDIGWEPLRPPKSADGGGDNAHRDPTADAAHHEPGHDPGHNFADGERPPTAGMVHRWHHRWLVSLDILTLAPPGQKPSGPTEKSDDL
jgi:hypothetical protein